MKKSVLFISAIVALGAIAMTTPSCTTPSGTTANSAADTTIAAGSIVYFDLDRVLAEYDMANDLSSVVNTKVNSIQEEVNRRAGKLDKDQKAFQDKVNKGLMTQSTAEQQYQKLLEQQGTFQNYAQEKQNEINEELAVTQNKILDAISSFVKEYNAEKNYAMIIASQGSTGVISMPVVAGQEHLDITDDLLEGLNAAYIKEKGKTE